MVALQLGAATRFPGKLFHRQTGMGEQCPPQQEFFDSLKYTSSSRHQWRTKLLLFRKTAIKNTPQLRARYLFGAPSGTRTQDPLIKSQLLSQVASSRGVENSVTQTDSGLYIYFYNLCLTVLENNIISDHLQLIFPLSIGSVADYVYRAICVSNFLIKCCSCF